SATGRPIHSSWPPVAGHVFFATATRCRRGNPPSKRLGTKGSPMVCLSVLRQTAESISQTSPHRALSHAQKECPSLTHRSPAPPAGEMSHLPDPRSPPVSTGGRTAPPPAPPWLRADPRWCRCDS